MLIANPPAMGPTGRGPNGGWIGLPSLDIARKQLRTWANMGASDGERTRTGDGRGAVPDGATRRGEFSSVYPRATET